jgi:Domain of unknown function (DUF4190)/Domain of unknown function (DUF1707)
MSDWQSMRASDADRERAADVLKAALAEGRLNYDEHRARLDRLMRSGTYGEMQQVVHDLPAGGLPFPHHPPGELVRPTHGAINPWATPYQPYVQPRPNEGLAQASLILGILTPFCGITSIPAIITGHLALSRIRETGAAGRGMAIAGLVIGYLYGAFIVLAVIAGIAGAWD